MTQLKTVEDYIKNSPPRIQEKLKELRKIIRSIAPKAEEKISYGMPYYGYKGRFAYFRASKNHIGLYLVPPTISEHKKELENYKTSTATIQFPNDQKLPVSLIKKLLKYRLRKNEENAGHSA